MIKKIFQLNRKNKSAARIGGDAGFTLIEALVYLGLFAILFGGVLAAAYNVLETSGKNQTKTIVQQEGDFLVAKINWVLSGDQAINQPVVGQTSSMLSVNKITGLNLNNLPVLTPVTLVVSGSDLMIGYPDGRPNDPTPPPVSLPLNNSGVSVSNLEFNHSIDSGDGLNPENVRATFTITGKTSTGAEYAQDFETTVYLHK